MFTYSSIPTITIDGENISQTYEASSITNGTSSQEVIKDRCRSGPNTLHGDFPAVAPTKKRCYVLRKVIKGISNVIKAFTSTYNLPHKICDQRMAADMLFETPTGI
ncbi:uncharacterized protein EAE97_007059 [Botrytis byssoidea]|uniref:Uncharacterized protein n=1 Tax=Botrytis byssoidea TaxID=139641 RepID=A0A9P5IMD5_9HELO|nr:uncharacterized protein EAE97_007059 [Botrytis byssoidea]KAF7940874.1 hypothetical protein EAE97_007059 [Botrytis byssoidea]